MIVNMGITDRYIRFLTGVAVLLQILILETGVIGTIIFLIIGGILLYTSYSGFCALYTPLKIDTTGRKAEQEEAAEASAE